MKNVNLKKPITLKNRTKYFDPNKDKVQVTFASTDSHRFRENKIEGYETRLYWQYKYCESVGGQTFFYTLTYNDNHIPNHYGINCFDYDDLRDLLTGGFRKQLLRRYGTTFKYFVGSELGEGQGTRGYHNNPHYHILFFLEPDKGSLSRRPFPYVKISSEAFRTLIKRYWQGFDENVDGFHDFRTALYGIAQEGSYNMGLVTDYRAAVYCAKYVCKDVSLKQHEVNVESSLRLSARNELKDNEEVYKRFFHEVICYKYNIPLDFKMNSFYFDDVSLIERLSSSVEFSQNNLFDVLSVQEYKPYVIKLCDELGLWTEYKDFLNSLIDEKVKQGICEYRNRFCNKCRISHGVGDYALEFVSDRLNPTFQVATKDGFKDRPCSMYYYRKLFTDVVKDSKGSNLYLLNDLGIKYKTLKLHSSLEKLSEKALSHLNVIVNNRSLYDKMLDSDVNVDVNISYDDFLVQLFKLYGESSTKEICYRYGAYKLVYEDRFFPFDDSGSDLPCDFPDIDVFGDYQRFLVPSFYSVSRSDLRLDSFLECGNKGFLPYESHPYFLRYMCVFRVLSLCADYFFIQKDDKDEAEAKERRELKLFHDVSKTYSLLSLLN